MAQLGYSNAIIAAGESLSAPCDCQSGRPVRILTPADWDGGDLTFQVSIEGTNYYDLYDASGKEVRIVCDGGQRAVVLPESAAIAVAFVKIRSGWGSSPVVQRAERTFRITMDNTAVY